MRFDLFVDEVFFSLNGGGELGIEKKDKLRTLPYLQQLIRSHNITTLNVPTAFFHELVASRFDFDGIKKIIVGGEALAHSRAEALIDNFPQINLHNTYGPTEATIISTAVCISKSLLRQHSSGPVEFPIANTQIYIVDQHNHPRPMGVAGERHI